jgi:outer membrane protein OmpA-like peptidoglycan-associated protein
MKKIILILFALANFSMFVLAQEKSSKEIKGDSFYFIHEYAKAINKYESTTLTEDGLRKYASALQKIERNIEAETQYANLVKLSNGKAPEDYFNYASILKNNGKQNDYFFWMDKFSVLKPADLRVKSYQNNKDNFEALLFDQKKQSIRHLTINTDDQDFGTAFMNDKVVFASSRAKPKMIKRTDNRTGKPFLILYESDIQDNQLSKPSKFNKKMNSKKNDGPASFSQKGTFMAFTRNNEKDKSDDKIVELQIHFSSLKNGVWSEPIPFEFNNPAYSVGQPCLSEDGKTMYFTSDMPGGYGGSDIYKSTMNQNGAWSNPLNMGAALNTESDEMFPFYDEQTKILYFASDGHFGIGGLDIFSFKNEQVTNLGSPVNSRQDDFALILNSTTQQGFFSSNRLSGSGSDDIYSVSFLEKMKVELKIEGIAKTIDNTQLNDVMVKLYDENRNVLQSASTGLNGKFSFTVVDDKKYILIGNKNGYIEGFNSVSSFGNATVVTCDLVLMNNNLLEIDIIEIDTDLGKKFNLNPIYFDYDMYSIREDAAIELNKIVTIMNKNPAMEVSLKSYTDCRGPLDYNQYLSDKRATASAEYIKARITNPDRINGKGYGESNSLNDCVCEDNVMSNCPKEQHQQNRRTEFIVVKK